MPISLTELKERVVPVDVFGNGDLTVHYRLTESFTAEEEAELARFITDGNSDAATDAFADLICRVIARWDLYDKPQDQGGELIPLTPEAVKTVPTELTRRIMAAVREDRDPNSKETSSQGRLRPASHGSWGQRGRSLQNGRHQ